LRRSWPHIIPICSARRCFKSPHYGERGCRDEGVISGHSGSRRRIREAPKGEAGEEAETLRARQNGCWRSSCESCSMIFSFLGARYNRTYRGDFTLSQLVISIPTRIYTHPCQENRGGTRSTVMVHTTRSQTLITVGECVAPLATSTQ
jgi:hypothetical protein